MSKSKTRRTPNTKRATRVVVRKGCAIGKTGALPEQIADAQPPRGGMEGISLRDFAKLLDKSTSTVSAWCEAGMPHEQPGKTNEGFVIRLEVALPWVMQHALTPPPESQRERLAREQADKIALENAQRRGSLLDAEQYGMVLQQLTITCQQQLKTVENRCTHEFCGIVEPVRMRERFREEHRNVLEAMAAVTGVCAEACERAAEDALAAGASAHPGTVGGRKQDPAQG